MKPFQGFGGFTPTNAFMQADTTPEEIAPGQGMRVFEKILQQMQATQQSKKTAEKSKVDMLWPMGTAVRGKI